MVSTLVLRLPGGSRPGLNCRIVSLGKKLNSTFSLLFPKPRSRVRILIYQNWPVARNCLNHASFRLNMFSTGVNTT